MYQVFRRTPKDMRASKSIVLAILVSAASGCYTERPLTTLPPPPSTHIAATLTDSGTVALSNAIGPGALAVEGVVSAADSAVWVLQMLRVDHRDGRTVDWSREPVTFEPRFLTQPRVKVLDKKRTWLAAGGIAVGAFVLASAFDLFGAPEQDRGGPPPPPVSLIPVGGR